MDRIAKRIRKSGKDANVYGPNEMHPLRERLNPKELTEIWTRPFIMFVCGWSLPFLGFSS